MTSHALNKLVNDGYLYFNPQLNKDFDANDPVYSITLDGIVFLSTGGYVGQRASSQSISDRIERVERQNRFLQIVLALGAAVAAVYYGLEIWRFFYPAVETAIKK